MNQAPSMLKPALISGVAFGVAGSIPVVNWINCACCALIIGCGFFAAFLYSKDSRAAGFPLPTKARLARGRACHSPCFTFLPSPLSRLASFVFLSAGLYTENERPAGEENISGRRS